MTKQLAVIIVWCTKLVAKQQILHFDLMSVRPQRIVLISLAKVGISKFSSYTLHTSYSSFITFYGLSTLCCIVIRESRHLVCCWVHPGVMSSCLAVPECTLVLFRMAANILIKIWWRDSLSQVYLFRCSVIVNTPATVWIVYCFWICIISGMIISSVSNIWV